MNDLPAGYQIEDSPAGPILYSPRVEDGSAIIEALGSEDSIRIDPLGAKIRLLKLNGEVVLTTVKRADGKQGITHPCTPNFGLVEEAKKLDLPQHGPARNLLWEVAPKDFSQSVERVTRSLSLTVPKTGSFPDGLSVRQEFELAPGKCTLTTTHTNNGEGVAPVVFGEHFYFNVLYAPTWEGLRINGADATDLVRQNGRVNLEPENIIELPGKPVIKMRQSGLSVAVLWTGGSGGSLDKHYVCIEPVEMSPDKFCLPESMIKPGESRTNFVSLEVLK